MAGREETNGNILPPPPRVPTRFRPALLPVVQRPMVRDGRGVGFRRAAGQLRSRAGRWMASGVASSTSWKLLSKGPAVAAAENPNPVSAHAPGL